MGWGVEGGCVDLLPPGGDLSEAAVAGHRGAQTPCSQKEDPSTCVA